MAAGHVRVAPMREDQLADAEEIMVRAFSDEPLFVAGFPDPIERAGILPLVAAWNFRHGLMFGEIFVAGDPPEGVVIAYRAVGSPPYSAERVSDSIGDLPSRLGNDLWARWERMQIPFETADAHLEATMGRPHWYVDMISVEPTRQGKGIGRALLEAVHLRADADGMPTGLLTFRAQNLPIYTHLGYELIGAGADTTSGLDYWCFRRPPGMAK